MKWLKITWTTNHLEKNGRQAYTTGLDLLGFKYENRTEPFQGAVRCNTPSSCRSSNTVSSSSLQRIITSRWTCKNTSYGVKSQTEQQAQRVKDYMNYLIMDQMKEYEPEFDQMLFHLPLSRFYI